MTDLTDNTEEMEPRMTQIARLDGNGVYHGMQEIPESELQDHHVHLPQGCDLPSGKYRWDDAQKTFIPLSETPSESAPNPDALSAIAIGFISLHVGGQPLPEKTLRWLDFYISSIDFAYSKGIESMLNEYKAKRKG